MPADTPADADRLCAEALSAGDLDSALEMYEQDASYIDGNGKTART